MLKSQELKDELEKMKVEAKSLTNKKGVTASELNSKSAEIEDLTARIGEQERIEADEAAEAMNKINNGGMSPITGNSNFRSNNSNLRFLNSSNITNIYKNSDNLDLGSYVKGALTGQWGNAQNEMSEFKALSTGTGSVLIPTSLSAEILKKVMNKSLIYSSGVPVIDMPNGNITIAKVINNPSFSFKAELEPVTPQDATFEGVNLKGKMVYGLMKISLEVLHSAENLSDILYQAMSDSIADSIDKAMLYGTGTTDIKGIFNYDTINAINASGVNYDSFVKAIGSIRAKNGEPTVMGINATTDMKLNLLHDSTGQPLQAPKVVENLNRIISNNLRSNLGSGTDESEAIVYDPNALIIGNQVQFMFETSREKGFEDGSVWLRVYSLLDMAITRSEYISHITALKDIN